MFRWRGVSRGAGAPPCRRRGAVPVEVPGVAICPATSPIWPGAWLVAALQAGAVGDSRGTLCTCCGQSQRPAALVERDALPAPDPFNGALVRFTVGQETGKYCLNEAWDTMAMPTGNPYPLDSHCSKDCTSERLPAHCAPARLPLSAGCIE